MCAYVCLNVVLLHATCTPAHMHTRAHTTHAHTVTSRHPLTMHLVLPPPLNPRLARISFDCWCPADGSKSPVHRGNSGEKSIFRARTRPTRLSQHPPASSFPSPRRKGPSAALSKGFKHAMVPTQGTPDGMSVASGLDESIRACVRACAPCTRCVLSPHGSLASRVCAAEGGDWKGSVPACAVEGVGKDGERRRRGTVEAAAGGRADRSEEGRNRCE